ncbi:hypothetical protein LPC08_25305 (plasmid) [Roseomonas sp. OT10]|uniref:hypothetical protein n=1 Tax=Roseomonas cutis TaxID=2897332 RepID=UPI001E5180E5|nr:hypothetical protein [Roseomonas sp. OT10]UFN51584.1 hypothetical protein LPC08_25305 [Roseomonas sp. OT10]
MSEEISQAKAKALQSLYRDPDNHPFFTWAAGRQKDSRETSVDTVRRHGQLGHEAAVGLLQDLANAGFGRFVVGRRGAKTRIVWDYSIRDVGAAASGSTKEIHKVDEDEVVEDEAAEGDDGALVEHVFNLRPGLRISIELPADLTSREAERLAKFIEALPQ